MRMMNNLKTTFLLASLMALCLLVGNAMGGSRGMLIGLIVGGAGNLIAFFFSDKLAIAASGAREVHREDIPWLWDSVEELAHRARLPMPRVYVTPQAAPNAFATGRSPSHSAVAVSQGMLQGFPRNEIEAVIAHELGHIRNRDILTGTIAAVMAGMLSYAGHMLLWFGHGRSSENSSPFAAIGTIVLIVLAPIAALIIQLAISRQREYAADSYAGELVGQPLHLAAALSRLRVGNERIPTETNPAFHSLYICAPLSGGGVMSLFSTHPPIEKRIAALEQQAAQMGRA